MMIVVAVARVDEGIVVVRGRGVDTMMVVMMVWVGSAHRGVGNMVMVDILR